MERQPYLIEITKLYIIYSGPVVSRWASGNMLIMISTAAEKYRIRSKLTILLIEDDQLTRLGIRHKLGPYARVIEAKNTSEALEVESFDMAIIDLDLEKEREGLALIEHFASRKKYLTVLTAHHDRKTVKEAYGRGCHDYLCKPFSDDDLKQLLFRFYCFSRSKDLEKRCQEIGLPSDEKFIAAACSTIPLLLTGESGTGKTLLAREIHDASSDGPFIHLNCSEVPESLLESELFGHVKGAFSGAVTSRLGKLELACGGTLFLDELSTMPTVTQQKLLRAIEEKSFYPIGSNKKKEVDFRLISATCDNLEEMLKQKTFRKDLYFRIAGFEHFIPPLRQRLEYLPRYIEYQMKNNSRQMIFEQEALDVLSHYHWPGNLRELTYLLKMLEARRVGVVKASDLEYLVGPSAKTNELKEVKEVGLRPMLKRYERELVMRVLRENKGHVRNTLKVLKISNATYYSIIREGKNERSNCS